MASPFDLLAHFDVDGRWPPPYADFLKLFEKYGIRDPERHYELHRQYLMRSGLADAWGITCHPSLRAWWNYKTYRGETK